MEEFKNGDLVTIKSLEDAVRDTGKKKDSFSYNFFDMFAGEKFIFREKKTCIAVIELTKDYTSYYYKNKIICVNYAVIDRYNKFSLPDELFTM